MLVHVPKSFDRDKTIHGLTTTLLSEYTMQPEIEDQLFQSIFHSMGRWIVVHYLISDTVSSSNVKRNNVFDSITKNKYETPYQIPSWLFSRNIRLLALLI